MEFSELMARRWSCREYRPDPVPDDVLAGIFQAAQRTATWCNSQPWQVHLVSGEAREQLAKEYTEHVAGMPAESPDLPLPERYEGVYADRRRAAGYALYESLGIARDDRPARAGAMLRNFSFFGAPHVAVITSERELGVYGAVDCGGYVTNLMHAALDVGVASIAQGALGIYAGPLRDFLQLPEERVVVCGVALGYPDEEHPVNQFRTERAALTDVVTEVRS